LVTAALRITPELFRSAFASTSRIHQGDIPMNENILELLKNQLTGPILNQIAQLLGLSESKAKSGLESAFATMLAGLLQKAGRPGGIDSLLSMFKHGGHEGDILQNLGSVLGASDKSQALLTSGQSLLNSIFGDKLASVENTLGSAIGLPKGSASSLLALAAPLVMGQIGKLVSARGLNAAGLGELLMGQKKVLQAVSVPGLSSALGLNSLADLGGDLKERAGRAADAAVRTGQVAAEGAASWLKWAVPVGLLALAALAIYMLIPREPAKPGAPPLTADANITGAERSAADLAAKGKEKIENAITDVKRETRNAGAKIATAAEGARQSVANAAERTANAAEAIKEKLTTFTLPGDLKLELPANSALASFATFLQSPNPDLSRVFAINSFEDDAATPQAAAASRAKIDILAKILKAYPAANIKFVGHSNVVSDSEQRKADGLRRATDAKNLLVERGVAEDRVAAEGSEAEANTTSLELRVTKL
jgi:outer membrane protein OmpA-like peptidoglycan-associated protein